MLMYTHLLCCLARCVLLCRRYRLPAEAPPRSAYAAAALAAIDAAEADAELRADRMANALLVPALGESAHAVM